MEKQNKTQNKNNANTQNAQRNCKNTTEQKADR